MMILGIKQQLSNIWSSIHEKARRHWRWVGEEALLIKNTFICNLYLFFSQNM